MPAKLTYEFVKKVIEDKGGVLLSEEYVKARDKLQVQCKNNHIWYTTFDKIKQNHWCCFCVSNVKKTIEDCIESAKTKNGRCLSTKYINTQTKYLWECEKNHQWYARYNDVRQGKWCPNCVGKNKTINACIKLAIEKNGKCLSEKYENNKTSLMWECELGHQWSANYGNVSQGKWCPFCAGKYKNIEDCRKLAEKMDGKCLSEKYTNNHEHLVWECKLGHQWSTSYQSVSQGCWCPVCCKSKSQKQLFEIVKSIFPNDNVLYNFRGFSWLKVDKRKQEIDIFVSGFKLAIEYDGEQHFKPIEYFGGIEKFQKTQQLDQTKNKLIAEHPEDVKTFIRIPYREPITEINIKKILKENNIL